MYTKYVSNALRGQKRALEPLELELWMVVSYHGGAGNGTQIIPKNSKYSYLLSQLSCFST